MISITIADLPCPRCHNLMSIHIGDRHHYYTCVECSYVASPEIDCTQRVDIINPLTGEVKIRAKDR
jgi:hypothetical protein